MTLDLVPLENVAKTRARLRHLRVVVTNGCFDVLHVGHVRYLEEAKDRGDILWVGLNSDESVRELKGENRPIFNAEERAEMLLALNCVDAVTIFKGKRCDDFLSLVQPDVYVKGGDYTLESLDPGERAALQEAGTTIEFVPITAVHSTSKLIARF